MWPMIDKRKDVIIKIPGRTLLIVENTTEDIKSIGLIYISMIKSRILVNFII